MSQQFLFSKNLSMCSSPYSCLKSENAGHMFYSVVFIAMAFLLFIGLTPSAKAQAVNAQENIVAVTHKEAASISKNANPRTEGAKTFISSMASRGINFLANPELSIEERSKAFENLLADSFDMNTIAKFALGRYWRTINSKQEKEYISLFKKMVVQVYSQRFSEYNGQDFKIKEARPQGTKDTIVSSFVIPQEGPEIEVEWRVRYKNGRYKIIDVIVEGVSMGVTQRADFASVIQRGGGSVDVLLQHLRGT